MQLLLGLTSDLTYALQYFMLLSFVLQYFMSLKKG